MEETKKVERVKKVAVTVVRTEGDAVLVEYAAKGDLVRVVVPDKCVQDGQAPLSDLEVGIPYGLPWEDLIVLKATPEDVARRLRANGIWTYEDLLKLQQDARGAVQASYSLDLAGLIEAAREFKQ